MRSFKAHSLNSSNSLSDVSKDPVPVIIKVALFLNLFVSIFLYRGVLDIYYGYLTYLVLLPPFVIRYGIPRNMVYVFGVLLLTGLFNVTIGNNIMAAFLKVFIGVFVSYLFFYYIVISLGYSVFQLFKIYLKFSLFCSLFGVFQLTAYLLRVPVGSGLPWLFGILSSVNGGLFGIRISTFFGEPTYHAIFMSGAVFVAIHDFIFQKKAFYFSRVYAVALIVGVYLSFSGTLLGTLGLTFLFIAINYGLFKYLYLILPLGLLLFFQVFNSSEEFSGRLEGTISIFTDAPDKDFNVFDYHGSSVILYNNFHVAVQNFKRNPLFGSGLGSHPVAFQKYSLTKHVKVLGFNLNSKDANSMFSRLLSETGLFGLGLFFFIMFKFFVRKNEDDEKTNKQLWIVSTACLIVIIMNLVRQGHFFLNGFPFYIWMYYAAWKRKKIGSDAVRK